MTHLFSRNATASDWLMAVTIASFVVGLFAMGPWATP
jgi:hypothetical protein